MKLINISKNPSVTFLLFKEDQTNIEMHLKVPAGHTLADSFVEGNDYNIIIKVIEKIEPNE